MLGVNIKRIPEISLLRCKYNYSRKILAKCINSVKSGTLDEIYTDSYKLSNASNNETTVKNLLTNKPEIVKIVEQISKHTDKYHNHSEIYDVIDLKGNTLGRKRFFVVKDNNKNYFAPGCIESYKNDIYSGVQIRLLQLACEMAKKLGVKEMSIDSLVQAVIFHTKMGFRPDISYSFKLQSLNDIAKYNKCLLEYWKDYINPKFYTPILSKSKQGEYYLDANRTLFCSSLIQNKIGLERTKQRHLIYQHSLALEDTIMMTLSGTELENWFNRLKGFEILSKNNIKV